MWKMEDNVIYGLLVFFGILFLFEEIICLNVVVFTSKHNTFSHRVAHYNNGNEQHNSNFIINIYKRTLSSCCKPKKGSKQLWLRATINIQILYIVNRSIGNKKFIHSKKPSSLVYYRLGLLQIHATNKSIPPINYTIVFFFLFKWHYIKGFLI
jgi:hypothetical protein